MIINEQSDYKYQIKKTLNKMQNMNKRQYNFMLEIFEPYMSIKVRLNFLQFARFGKFYEQSYNAPELNHSEKIWAYIKQSYKNKVFGSLDNVKSGLHNFIKYKLAPDTIMSITPHIFFCTLLQAVCIPNWY